MNTIERVAAHRPDDVAIDRLWALGNQDEVLARVLADQASVRFRPRTARRRLVLAVASVAAAAALALSVVLPDGAPGGASPAAAAELDRLARVAAASAYDSAGPRQFVHMVEISRQDGNFEGNQPADRGVYSRRSESWIANDGSVWEMNRLLDSDPPRTDAGAYETRYERYPAGRAWLNYPSPDYLASLPTDPDGLERYLRDHVSGSTSRSEAMFVAIADMLGGGLAPSELRQAAIQVLERIPHVGLGSATMDTRGRPVVEFTFIDEVARPGSVHALRFSTTTAEIIEELSIYQGIPEYVSTVVSTDVVDAVPRRVLKRAMPPEAAAGLVESVG